MEENYIYIYIFLFFFKKREILCHNIFITFHKKILNSRLLSTITTGKKKLKNN